MRVIHVEAGRHLYGGARQVLYLLEGLQARGVDNWLVCPQNSAIAQAARGLARVIEWPMGGDFDMWLLVRLVRLLRQHRPSLLHLHSRRGADLWGGLAARLTGVPAILSRRVDNPEPSWWVRRKYPLYRRVITISQAIRQVLLAEGVPGHQLRCVLSAIEAGPFMGEGDRALLQRAFGFEPEDQVAGVIAQFIPRKGHRLLLEQWPALCARHPRLRLLLLGQGPLFGEMQQYAVTLGLGDRVCFAGFRDDLPALLPCLDLVIHPVFMEGLGVSLLQAAAAALPIVACRAGGVPEVVLDGVNGWLVEPGDGAGLAARIERLLLDPERARIMGLAGRAHVCDHFSVAAMVAGNWSVYREVLEC